MPNFIGEKSMEENPDAAQQAVRAETTSPRKREYRRLSFQIALFAAIAAFSVLTIIIRETPLLAVDIQITRALQSFNSPLFAGLMEGVSWLGFMPQSLIVPAVVALLIFRLGLHWEAVASLISALLPGLVNLLAKDLIRRPRPTVDLVTVFQVLDSYSFPSGHVMFYIGFLGFLCFLVFTLLRHSLLRTVLLVLLGSLIVLVGPSRIYLGQHWASDILGASLLGGLTLVFILQFYRWGKKRFFVRQPVAPS
jgi:membrane-associated phospholipid phosphatase